MEIKEETSNTKKKITPEDRIVITEQLARYNFRVTIWTMLASFIFGFIVFRSIKPERDIMTWMTLLFLAFLYINIAIYWPCRGVEQLKTKLKEKGYLQEGYSLPRKGIWQDIIISSVGYIIIAVIFTLMIFGVFP